MYRDNEKTMSAGRNTLGGSLQAECVPPQPPMQALEEVVRCTMNLLHTVQSNLDIIDAKLFASQPAKLLEAPSQAGIYPLAMGVREMASQCAQLSASIETRL